MPVSLRTCDSVPPWYGAWQRLWRRLDADPFLHPAWHAAYAASRGEELRPVIVGAWRSDELVGVLPMRRDRDGVLRFLSASQSDYEDALVDDRHRDDVLGVLVDFLLDERFDLAEVPQGSPLGHALEARGLAPQPAAPCPGVELSAATLHDVTRRQSLRRHAKRLSRRGPVSLDSVPAAARSGALRKLFDQHIARRTDVGDDSLFLNPLNRAFYEALTAHPDFAEFGAFHVLKAGAREVAFHVALKNRGTFIWYKPTFDLNLEAEGPGEVLLKLLFEHAYAGGATYFDFSRGEEPFKLRFANQARCNRRYMHRVPFMSRLLARLKRRRLQIRDDLRAAGRTLAHAMIRDHAIRLDADARNAPAAPEPEGYELACGEVDLVEFGALRLHCPGYVTPERMQSARQRRARGDQLLVVRRRADHVPVHCAWLRSAGGTRELFDSWTAPGRSARQVRRWATDWATRQAGRDDTRPSAQE
jgi:CelD/BcsL family acetyltransferase involved in cellulose biosynthesis